MKQFLRLFLLIFFALLATAVAEAQNNAKVQTKEQAQPGEPPKDLPSVIPQEYIFFGSDTLQGFDLNACYNDLGRYNVHSHLSKGERKSYMYFRQLDFVRTKYHLSGGRPFVDPLKAIEANGGKLPPASSYQPKPMGVQNPGNTLTGRGKLFSNGQGSNPKPESTNPSCVGWDWENGNGPKGSAAWANQTGCAGCTGSWNADVMYTVYPDYNNYQGQAEGVGLQDPDGNDANINTKCDHHVIVSTGTDPYGAGSMLYPGGGSYSVRMGAPLVNIGGNSAYGSANTYGNLCSYSYSGPYVNSPAGLASAGEIIWQNITVSANNALLTYYYNVVLSDGGHPAGEQPYFNAWILDLSSCGSGCPIITCSQYTQECTVGSPPPGYTQYCTTCWDGNGNDTPGPVNYSGWQANTIDMTAYIGKTIQVQFMTAGCTPGGHFGYAYVDGTCGPKELTVQNPPVCLGTGNMNVSAPPMPPGTHYSWSGTGTIVGSKTGSSISISTAGTFTVTITPPAPNNTCPITISSVVNFAPNPSEGIPSASNITCHGLTNGTATAANATGGTPAYAYNWSTGAGTQTASNLGVGTYTVTVTDLNGCTATNSINITAPTAVTASATTITNATCGKNNGAANSASGGGTPGYSYLWTGGATTQNVSALGANTYTVTITDTKGCTATSTAVITNTAGVTASAPSVSNLNCNGKSTGTATGVPSGGTPAYNYSWSQGAATQTISNLAAGTYTVTITDANSCTSTTTAVITQPATAVSASYTSVNSTCSTNNNGQATASGAGGTAGYVYSWNTGAATNVISGVASGSYTVTVTDTKGCTTTTTAIIGNTSGPVASISASSSVKCFGQSTGSATASQTGGTAGFSYTWAPSGGAASVASNLAIGTYTVTIKDANGCTSTSTATITQPASALSAAATPVSSTCGKANGTASVLAGGGTAGYTYLWTTGGTSSSISAAVAGAYTVTVTDSKGCTQSTTTNIGNTAGPTLSVSASTNVNCFGQATGSISTLEVNGTPGFSYVWAPSGGAGSSAANLGVGTYTVTITDANGCTSTTLQTITQPASGLTAATTPISSTCTANNNGQASVLAGGGTAGYAYQWTTGGTTSAISGLASGTYTVTVTDTKGCTKSATVAVGNTPGPVASANAVANVSCNRLATGSADASVTGGTSAFNYVWFPGGMTGANVGSLAAATYTVSVTDANGCTSTSTVNITQPPALVPTASGVTATCGNHNGSVSVSTTGGTPGYQYNWSSGATSQTVSGLAANTYTVTVTDSKGCTNSSVQTVSNAGGPTVAAAGSANLSCNGGSNGSASATVSGGAAPFNFAWSNGTTGTTGSAGFTSSISGLAAGTYTMSVTDANGCQSSVNVTLTAPAALNSSISSQTNAGCGGSNGQATITETGGTAGYFYTWSNGSTTNGISGVLANTYTLTVTDSKGCTGTTTVNITGSPAVTAASSNIHSTCGISNGQASATPGGGTPGFTYFWSPGGATAQTITALSPGTYSVTITDTKGCTITTTTTVASVLGPVLSVSSSANVNCFGQSTGSVSTTEVNGTPGFSYTWAPAGGAGATASGLAAGTYTVTIKDANNCTSTATQVVGQPAAALTASTTPVSSTCSANNNGQASVLAGNGTAGYSYLWSTGGTTTSISGVASGTYSVTVTDAKSCTVLTTVVIGNTPGPVLSASAVANVSCNRLATGSADASVTGGTAGFNYIWFPGGITGANAGSLSANTYTVSVTDANGCTSTTTVLITQPPALVPTASAVTATCGSHNGSVSVATAGGTPGYQFSWSTGATSQTVTGLAASNYTVTVTDSKGCTNSTVQTINNAGSPTVAIAGSANLTCNGGSNGTASATVSGTASPFSFAWSNGTTGSTGSTGFTSNLAGLTAGTYTLSVTDANGCLSSSNITLTAPAAINSSISSQTNAACGSGNGQAIVNVTGGTAGYFYTWSNGSTSNAISSVTANTYTLTVTDSKGCTSTTTVNITGSPAVTSASANVSSTCGISNGQASVSPGGGTPAFSYFWSPGGATGRTATSLSPGTYTVTVTDTKGCTSTTTASVGNTAGPTLSISASTNVNCFGQATGSVSTSEVSGTPGFSYTWAPAGGAGATASGLAAGTYTVTIKDANNCTSTATQVVGQPAAALTAATTPVSSTCTTNNNGQASVLAGNGTAGYSYLWSTGGTTTSISGVASGTYSVTVTDAKNCTVLTTAVIGNTPGPVLSANAVANVSCNRLSTGSADASVTGGTAGFNYIWFPGGITGANAGALSANTYTVSVTDANGCTSTSTVLITQPPSLIPTGSSVAATCGNPDGSVAVSTTGGTPAYQYIWSNGATSQTVTLLAANSYTVTVTDSKGCTNSTVKTINNASGPTVTALPAVNLTCNGDNNGSASVTVSGAAPPFHFAWSNGTTGSTGSTGFTSSISGLTAGTYTLSVTDINGCVVSDNVTLTAPLALSSSVSSQTNAACGGSNGQASVSASGGTSGYFYTWSNGSTTNGISGVTANTYSLTITDSKGCPFNTTVVIGGSPAVTSASANISSTCGISNGQASVSPGGGTPGFSYFWSPGGATAQTVTGLSPNSYTVTVTDTKGCTSTSVASIGNTAGPSLSVSAFSNVNCNGQSTGSVSTTEVGGTSGFSYVWAPAGGTGATASGLAAGTYTVTIKDANNCTSTATQVVAQPASALTAATTPVSSTCTSNNNGQASVLAGGGTAGYSYLWSTGGTNSSISGLGSATYDVTVTDAKNCTTTASAVISNTPGPVASASAVANVSCNRLSTGSADASVTGGTPGFDYVWFPGGNTGPNAGSLSANTYTVSVTDANGCTSTTTVLITEPPSLIPTASAVAATCGNPDGSVSVSATGGTPSYQYVWSTGATSQTVTGLAANSYSVTVTDSKGCTNSTVKTINNAGGPSVAISSSVNLTCSGDNNGSVSAIVSGASSPFSFAWSNGTTGSTGSTGFTSSIAGLTAGSYTLSVTDINGCVESNNVTLTAPLAVSSSISSQTNAACGSNNGHATVNVSGGTSGYFYTWSNGSTTNGISSVTANTYSLTVTDSKGCTEITTVNITGSPAVTSASANLSSTCGISNGQASVSPGGGTPGFSYFWSPGGATAQTVTGLSPNSYTVTVTDTKGCTSTSVAIIGNTAGPALSISTFSNVNCNGQATGSASTTEVGGTSGFTYDWAPTGGTGANASGLTAGTYTVTIKDANNCTSTVTQLIAQPAAALTAATTPVSSTCTANNNGQASVLAGGGTAAYSYLWSTSGTGSSISGLASGTYNVTVTDAKNCTTTASALINNTPGPVASAFAVTNVSCNRLNTGSASASVTGGTPGFDYVWFPGGSTGTNVGSLTANTYTVSVTDANGCTSVTTLTITEPPALNPTTSAVAATCGNSDGSVFVSASGGTPTYEYSWSTGATSQTVSGLLAKSYTVTVTDSKGCTNSTVQTINNAGGPAVAISGSVNLVCNGTNNGSVSATVSGASAPFNFAWSNGTTGSTGSTGFTSSISGLTAGSYTLSVTDINGCLSSQNVTLTAPPAIVSSISSQTNAGCGTSNGQASVSVTGGTGTYIYNWSNGSTTNGISGATANSYVLTVTDAKGCSDVTTVNITGSPAVTALTANVPSTCGVSNGQVSTTPGGGSPGFSYFWAPGGAAGQTVTGLASGTYTVTITDTQGCTATSFTTINSANGPVATFAPPTNIACGGNSTGVATITATGGTANYTYSWSTGITAITSSASNQISNLPASIYGVTITDANGCSSTSLIDLTQPGVLNPSLNSNLPTCGNKNGSVSVNVTGGTPAYTYVWNTGNSGQTINGLSAGGYTVTVSDGNGCSATLSEALNSPGAPLVSLDTVVKINCNGGRAGSITANVSGGTGTLVYSWSNGISGVTAISGLTAGSYVLSVTDANGCVSTLNTTLANPAILNPTISSQTNVSCGLSNGQATVAVAGGSGSYTYSWSNGTTTSAISGVAASVYTLMITDSLGCTATQLVTIGNSGSPTATLQSSVGAACNGESNGSASINASGGTPVYTYNWSAGVSGSSSVASNLAFGTYTVTVSDANGCTSVTNVSITQPARLSGTLTGTDLTCGSINGTDLATSSGGTGPYVFNWSNGFISTPVSLSSQISNLSAGIYSVTIVDANSCTQLLTNAIGKAPIPIVTLGGAATICIGQSATLNATILGGSPAYTYSWSNGSGSAGPLTVSPVTTTSYSLVVTDSTGCASTIEAVKVTVNQPLTVTLSSTGTVVCNGSTATLTAHATGGDNTYNYSWQPGSETGSSISITPGGSVIYTVTLTDNCGTPQTTATVPLTLDVPPAVTINSSVNTGCGAPFCVQFTGTSTPLSACTAIEWYFGNSDSSSASNPNYCYKTPGVYTYSMKCTDANGCATKQIGLNPITVLQNPTAVFTAPSVIAQDSAINFTSLSTGSTNILWNFGDTSSQANNTSVLVNPTHTWLDSGSFCIKLTAYNGGCTDSVVHCLSIAQACSLPKNIPNVFSPNGDGINDIFTIKSSGLTSLICTMFNRWGMLIYEYDAVKTGWDGHTFSDIKAPDGTYFYILKATCTDSKVTDGNGFLQLVR